MNRNKSGLLPEVRKALALVFAVLGGHFVFGARLWLILPELLLRRGDQAEIVFSMLIVIFGGDWIARGACVARELNIFFRYMGRGATDLDIGTVGLEHPGHRVLAAPVAVIPVVIIAVAHPLVVLTVSHVLPLSQP